MVEIGGSAQPSTKFMTLGQIWETNTVLSEIKAGASLAIGDA
jgi:hypothetical protein